MKDKKIDFRLSEQDLQKIDEAAKKLNLTRTAFILGSALERAFKVLK